ncbi:D-arabinono-1,4-lactone oxidase [Pyxidicoccus xibeiensis]|uniref:D-arabinono-1,4-lactone oxidase n=1 Tax=Pyxidicoccus xibeiensis TaxID=2906759 RepID=UPI0020A7FD8F|nr:D-arabinono-1,4-lactone oxidase [Pyxidicoccus xibeiensis]MCP3137929.1 FAD-binding protein [Pyxidicoccus xibeiensis]
MDLPSELQVATPARYPARMLSLLPHEEGAHGIPAIQDWGRIVSFEPSLYFRPRDLDSLGRFLTTLLGGGFPQRRVRIPGSLHSCSRICESDAILDVSALPRTLEYSEDHRAVTVSANWRLHDFLLELSRHGRALPATGGTDEQTLAGLISTNTAPATPQVTLYDTLEWLEYLSPGADGASFVEKRVSRDDPTFLSVVGSLGAIGVLTRARFRLIDEPFFETRQQVLPIDEVLGDLERTSREYDFWRIDWIPDSRNGLLWTAKRIRRAKADPDGDYPADQAANILEAVFAFYDRFTRGAGGPLLDDFMRLTYRIIAATYGETRARGPLRNMLPVDRRTPVRVAMAEWSFDPSDLKAVLALCRQYFGEAGWPNFPIEIELSRTDSYSMSAWNWEGLEYVVKFNFMYLTDVCKTDAEKALISTHLRGLWNRLLAKGIPFKAHWGKLNFMDPAFVREHYRMDRFQPLIQPLFLNDYLAERLVLPPAH